MSLLRRLVGGGSSSASKDVVEQLNEIIKGNNIAVFSKSWCPYCQETVSRLKKLKAEFYELQLDKLDNGAAMQDALQKISGQRTVPNIYIKQKHIGGNSDFQRLSENEILSVA